MIGNRTGLSAQVKEHLNNIGLDGNAFDFYHCIIHQEALCCKVLDFENLMKFVFTTVNFIRSRGLNHRQFRSFLKETHASFQDIPYHADVRWLSRGNVWKRFVELRLELCAFLT